MANTKSPVNIGLTESWRKGGDLRNAMNPWGAALPTTFIAIIAALMSWATFREAYTGYGDLRPTYLGDSTWGVSYEFGSGWVYIDGGEIMLAAVLLVLPFAILTVLALRGFARFGTRLEGDEPDEVAKGLQGRNRLAVAAAFALTGVAVVCVNNSYISLNMLIRDGSRAIMAWVLGVVTAIVCVLAAAFSARAYGLMNEVLRGFHYSGQKKLLFSACQAADIFGKIAVGAVAVNEVILLYALLYNMVSCFDIMLDDSTNPVHLVIMMLFCAAVCVPVHMLNRHRKEEGRVCCAIIDLQEK